MKTNKGHTYSLLQMDSIILRCRLWYLYFIYA